MLGLGVVGQQTARISFISSAAYATTVPSNHISRARRNNVITTFFLYALITLLRRALDMFALYMPMRLCCVCVDEDYEKREFRSNDQEMSMYGLRWDGAATRKVHTLLSLSLSKPHTERHELYDFVNMSAECRPTVLQTAPAFYNHS